MAELSDADALLALRRRRKDVLLVTARCDLGKMSAIRRALMAGGGAPASATYSAP